MMIRLRHVALMVTLTAAAPALAQTDLTALSLPELLALSGKCNQPGIHIPENCSHGHLSAHRRPDTEECQPDFVPSYHADMNASCQAVYRELHKTTREAAIKAQRDATDQKIKADRDAQQGKDAGWVNNYTGLK